MWISKKKFNELSELPFAIKDYSHLEKCIKAVRGELSDLQFELKEAKDMKNLRDLEIRAREIIEDPTIDIELTGVVDNGALLSKFSIRSKKVVSSGGAIGNKFYIYCGSLKEVKAYLDGYEEFKVNGKLPL